MRLVHKDLDHGKVKLRIQSDDDLWHLYNIILAGDVVFSLTERKDDAPADMVRAVKAGKKKMVLGIRVERLEFHDFSNRLRVTGIIEEGPQDLGSYHTLNLESGDEITVVKEKGWSKHLRERLQEAVEAAKRPSLLILALDDDEAVLTRLHHYGVKEVCKIKGPGSGKMFTQKGGKEDFFKDVYEQVTRTRTDCSPDGAEIPLVIVGPGFTKEDFTKWAKDKGIKLGSHVLHGTGQAGMAAVYEVMKSGTVEKALEGSRVLQEVSAVEEMMSEIAKNGKAAYGPNEVKEALEAGRVELLLVTDEEMRSGVGEKYLELATNMGSGHMVVSTTHDAGKQLKSFGGLGAILRY